MTFEQFSQEHFAGDEKKAMAHLVHESYYNDFSITGSRENLQELLNTFDKERTKQFWKAYRAAVSKDNKPFLKETGMEPLMDSVRLDELAGAEDEETVRKGNTFVRPLIGYSLLVVAVVIVLIVLQWLCVRHAWPETVRVLISVAGVVSVPSLFVKIIRLANGLVSFRKAEKRLNSKQANDN